VCPAPTAECEYEACVAGTCTPTPVAEGDPCLQTPTMMCDAASMCVPECVTPADCGMPPDDCVAWACTLSQCVQVPIADGQPCAIGAGVCNAGDCAECFSATDCPLPQTCFDRECNAGVCEEPPQPINTLCGPLMGCCSDQTCSTTCFL
jgi:hypothetical protein